MRFVFSNSSQKAFDFGVRLLREGKIKPAISKVMKLEDAAHAQDLVTAGGVHGKVVVETL